MSDNESPSTSWANWAWQAYRDGRLVEALPAVTVGADALSVGEAEATRLMLGAQKRMRQYKDRAEAAEAKVARLVEAATWAINHVSKLPMDEATQSEFMWHRAIIAEVQG